MTSENITKLEELHSAAQDMFLHALDACDVGKAFDRHLHFDGTTLIRHPSAALKPVSIPLERYKKIFVISFGKAAMTMLDALLERLPKKIHLRGVCSAPQMPKKRNWRIRYFTGGHPLPNEDSFAAAEAALKLLKRARKDTFVFFLISGGGSAMLELPRNQKISLDDTIAFHETLVASGATITEINTVRKYFSAVKGGRLALAAPEAEKLSLLLADVPLKDLGSVASSPTLPDQSTLEKCREILVRYHLLEKFPSDVRAYFESLSADVTAEMHGANADEAFKHTQFDTLLSNHDFVNAARDRAQELGFRVVIDNTCDDWDYADASRYLLKRFHDLRAQHPHLCLLSSGEVTVQLGLQPGCGGRNQQLTLASAFDLAKCEGQPLLVLSAGSDGIDGNSPAAGAIADTTTIARAREYHFDPEANLARFDTCPLFSALGDTIVTGPTGNNLRDLRILLASRTDTK
jgi:hydroxypyruvate reductase